MFVKIFDWVKIWVMCVVYAIRSEEEEDEECKRNGGKLSLVDDDTNGLPLLVKNVPICCFNPTTCVSFRVTMIRIR